MAPTSIYGVRSILILLLRNIAAQDRDAQIYEYYYHLLLGSSSITSTTNATYSDVFLDSTRDGSDKHRTTRGAGGENLKIWRVGLDRIG